MTEAGGASGTNDLEAVGHGGSRLDQLARSVADGTLSRRQTVSGIGATFAAILFAPVSSAFGREDCPGGRVECEGVCCPRGARCRRGKCRCPKGTVKCGTRCVDTKTSEKHCGRCRNRCADGQTCEQGVCTSPPSPASCSDGIKNGTETDVDCGGGCPGCANGKACQAGTDCQSGVCSGGVCAQPAATCTDGTKNGTETDVDCGGGSCPGCANGKACVAGSDCLSGNCTAGTCQPAPPTCTDLVQNGAETDVDCGGGTCPQCANGKACVVNGDCSSGHCVGGICVQCAVANDCPAPPVCIQRTCISGTCGTTPALTGTLCSAPTCTGDTFQPGSQCNGAGTCIPQPPVSCAPYTCNVSTCRTSCSSSAHCAAGHCCSGSVCVPTNTSSDVNNCGTCGNVCAGPNANMACVAGVCVIQSCNAGFADCNGLDADGCETALGTNAHCGFCFNACSGGTPNCVGGTCQP